VSLKDVYEGFPADLFVLLVGVTFLFGVATANGTVEWIVDRAAHPVDDRTRALPWVLFVVAAIPTTAGALGPAGIAILAPLGLRLGQRYGINPVLTSLMIVHGSAVGNFSPINVLGAIANQTVQREGLPSNPMLLFAGNALFNVLLGVAIYCI
jgi:Na+/H+ antiporter NhaC